MVLYLGLFLLSITVVPAFQIPLTSDTGEERFPLNAKFNAVVLQTLEKYHLMGLAIAVVDGNETISKARQLM